MQACYLSGDIFFCLLQLEVLDADEWPEGEAPTVEVLTDTITDQVGTPHNYSATDPGPTPDQDPPEVAPEAGEADDSAEAAGSAADRTDAFQPSADEVGFIIHQRCRVAGFCADLHCCLQSLRHKLLRWQRGTECLVKNSKSACSKF